MTSSEKLNALLLLDRWDAIDSEHQVEINHDMRFVSNKRELTNKMWTLGKDTERDRCGPTDYSKRVLGQAVRLVANSEIFNAATPRGSCALLKTL